LLTIWKPCHVGHFVTQVAEILGIWSEFIYG